VSVKKKTAIKPIYISLGLFLVLVVAFTIGDKSFLSLYNAQTILNAVGILLAVGLGQACVILTGGIDLSVGSIMSLVSVVFMLLLGPLGPWAFPVVLLIGLVSGALNGLIVSKLKIPSFIATLGTQGILLSIAYLLSAGPLSVPDNANGALVDIVNGAIGPIKSVWIIGLATFALFFAMERYSRIGRGIIYIGANERMSYLSGLDIDRIRLVAFSMSGLGAAIAGVVLSSTLYSGYPTIGGVYVLNSIAVVVVGGTAMTGGAGGMLNTLVGALIMGILNNGMTVVGIDVYAQQVFLGVLVIFAVAVTFDRKKLAIIK
jgi:ribose/xylose/arabinose/galactoside ABC-type transport system permease subunit